MLMVQPSLESVLNDALGLDDTTPFELLERRWPNLFTILVSHVATALILSPVQVLRVRYAPRSDPALFPPVRAVDLTWPQSRCACRCARRLWVAARAG